MSPEAGTTHDEPVINSPETDRLSPTEIHEIITSSHEQFYQTNTRTEDEQFCLSFYETNYKNNPHGQEVINELIGLIPNISEIEIQQSYLRGLSRSFIVSQKIPVLSEYKLEEIAPGYDARFRLILESFKRISKNLKPPKTIFKQILEYPNCFSPTIYEFFLSQIQEDSYFTQDNIFEHIRYSPNIAENQLKRKNKIFTTIRELLKEYLPTGFIKSAIIRKEIDRHGDEAISIIRKNPKDYCSIEKENNKEKKQPKKRISPDEKLLSVNKKLNEQYQTLKAKLAKLKLQNASLNGENLTLKVEIRALREIVSQAKKEKSTNRNHSISDDLIPRSIPKTPDQPVISSDSKSLKPSRPIDKISSSDSTLEKKIKNIKDRFANNSFAQDWVIEQFLLHYPDNPDEKLIELETLLSDWKNTLPDNFKDSWILRHYIVYFPDDYQDRYSEAQKAYTEFIKKFRVLNGFTTTDTLKNIVVYYFQDRNQAVETGLRLYPELYERFSKRALVNYNSSVINRYIIRNFDNPEEELKRACDDFDSLLKNATENPDNIFHSENKSEFSSEKYLRLLFENYPIDTINSIPRIKQAYQQLYSQFENDDFFGNYKILALKFIAITSTERPVLGYTKLKKKFIQIIDFHNRYGLERDCTIEAYLKHPAFAPALLEQKIQFDLRKKYKKEISQKNF